jgi:hypothetical protein
MAKSPTINKGRSERSESLPSRNVARKGDYRQGELGESEWIVASKDNVAKLLCETGKTLCTNQGYRLWDNTRFLSMYSNTDFMTPYYGNPGVDTAPMPRMSYNVIKICTDTLVGKLIQSNSRVTIQTTGGDFTDWQKARKIELAIEGEFNTMRLYKHAQLVALDGITCGTGWLKLWKEDNKIWCERIYVNEVFVDEVEAAYGPPTKLYQVRYIKKDTLLAKYPQYAEIIRKASTVNPPRFAWTLFTPGLVEVWEGWALPIGGRPGRHTMAINTGFIHDEEWAEPFFPLIPFRSGDKPFGWYGQGYIEQTMATQIDLNKTINVMQRAAHLGIAPYWIVDEGASLNIRHLTNRVGHVVETNSTDPKWVTNSPFHPDAVKYVQQLEQMIMQYYGMNEMDTGGQTPLNRIDSAPALREYQDMGSTRQTMLLERWEEFYIEVAKRTIMLAGQIAKESGKGYPVTSKKDYQSAIHLDWKDLDLDADSYTMCAAVANLLSRTPAGRMQDVQDLKAMGIITPDQAIRLMRGPPDIDAIVNEASALNDNIDMAIAEIVDHNNYIPPTTFNVTPATINRITNARLEYQNRNAPDSVLAMFDRWISDAKAVVELMTPPAQPAMPGAPGTQPTVGTPNGQPAPGPTPAGPAPGGLSPTANSAPAPAGVAGTATPSPQ